jgi:hypothetical protein
MASVLTSMDKSKRARVDLSGSEKREICLVHKKHPGLTHEELAEYMVKNKSGFKLVNRSTISKILKEQEKWLKVDTKLREGTNKRAREAKFPQLEKALLIWFAQIRARKGIISDVVLLKKAEEFRTSLGISKAEFKLSHGWFGNFKSRNRIASHYLRGESSDANVEGVRTAISKVP